MRERADWARGRRRSLRFAIGGIAAIGIAALSLGLAIAQSQINPALEAYVAGLDAIRQGRYQAAVDALTRATQSGSDPSFLLARGVALCLDEKLAQAIDDLNRAKNGGLRGREADLWVYSAQMMSSGSRAGRCPAGGPGETWFGWRPRSRHPGPRRLSRPTTHRSSTTKWPPRIQGHHAGGARGDAPGGAWFANRAGTRPDLAPAHLASRADALRPARVSGRAAGAGVRAPALSGERRSPLLLGTSPGSPSAGPRPPDVN